MYAFNSSVGSASVFVVFLFFFLSDAFCQYFFGVPLAETEEYAN